MIRKAYCYSNEDEAVTPPTFAFTVDEVTARCLAAGCVTASLSQAARRQVEWSLEDVAAEAERQRASRPGSAQRTDSEAAQGRQAKGTKRGNR